MESTVSPIGLLVKPIVPMDLTVDHSNRKNPLAISGLNAATESDGISHEIMNAAEKLLSFPEIFAQALTW